MNAMNIASKSAPTTIGELQEYLADLEASWSAQDIQYLGEFKDQSIYCADERGIGAAKCGYTAEFGLVAYVI
jgi:hypothetical protein